MSAAAWYVHRLLAMSPREVAWRATAPPRRQVAELRGRRPRSTAWSAARWREVLAAAAAERPALLGDGRRIAAGELELWGVPVRLDPLAPSWNADPLDGAPVPAGSWRRWGRDPKPFWELHRQQHLLPLAAAALSDASLAPLVRRHVLDWDAWARREPELALPSAYEVAHRLVGWAWALPLLAGERRSSAVDAIEASYARQARFVAARPSRFSSANNHRIVELVGLLAAAHVLGETGRWRALWLELEDEVARQIHGDGGSREQAAGYFLYVLESVWAAAAMAVARGASLGRLEARLRAMLSWLDAVADAAGEPPPAGDDAEDRLLRPDYFEPRRAHAIAYRAERVLGGSVTLADGQPPRRPPRASVLLAESGLAVLRTTVDDEPARVVFDVGPLGFGALAAHGHADALAVLLDLGGPVLRDSGTGSYLVSEGRELLRATDAHDTVTVDGRSQVEPLGPHMWRRRRFRVRVEAASFGDEVDYVRASHDAYRPRHTRSVVLVKPDLLLVLDRIAGRQPSTATLAWQLMPGELPARLAGGRASLAVASAPRAAAAIADAPYSPRYGHWEAAERDGGREHDHLAGRMPRRAPGEVVVFATAVSLGSRAREPRLTLTPTDGGALVELHGPRALRLRESWSADSPAIER